jgi:hypothetical protein
MKYGYVRTSTAEGILAGDERGNDRTNNTASRTTAAGAATVAHRPSL